MPRLRESLLDTSLVRLRVIADFWEIPLTSSRQREVALELTEALDDPDAVGFALGKLTDDQEQALRALLASEGRMPRRVFARDWGRIRRMGPGRMEREKPWQDPVSPAEALWYRGFLYLSFGEGPEGAYDAVHVPPELSQHLPTPKVAERTITLEPADTPGAVHSCGDRFLDDGCLLVAYVHNQRPRTRADAGWPDRHEQRLLARLHATNRERFLFLRQLASTIGWLVEGEDGHLRLEPEAVTTWLEGGTFHQTSALTETWIDDPVWNDLFHVPGLQPEDTGAWRNDPLLAHHAILRHLKACQPATWYEIESFIEAVKRVDPDFQRPSGDYDSWYIKDKESGAYLSGFESWHAVEGRLLRYLITKPLAWLGLVDLGTEGRDQEPQTFRLSPHGAAFLELADPPAEGPPPPARLLPGFRVAMPPRRRYDHFQLARVAEWVRTGDHFVYRLTPASLKRARQQAIAISRVLEFLEEITEAPLPRRLEKALTQWEARGTEASLERGVLLTVSDGQLMEKVLASPRLAPLIEERLGPKAALVREKDWFQVVTRLEEMGILPEVTGLSP